MVLSRPSLTLRTPRRPILTIEIRMVIALSTTVSYTSSITLPRATRTISLRSKLTIVTSLRAMT
jgi:hypothetical protein